MDMRSVIFLAVIQLSFFLRAQEFFNEDPYGYNRLNSGIIGQAITTRPAPPGSHTNTTLVSRELLENSMKSPEELMTYFSCNMQPEQQARLEEFRQTYLPLIRLASSHFGVPYAMSACLMFKESVLNPNTRNSGAGAQGISQVMPHTYARYQQEIRDARPGNSRNLRGQHEEFLQMIRNGEDYMNMAAPGGIHTPTTRNTFVVWTQFLRGEGPYYEHSSAEERRRSRANAVEGASRFLRIQETYDRYQTFMMQATGQSASAVHAMSPPESLRQMTQNPQWVVAMNFWHLSDLISRTESGVRRDTAGNAMITRNTDLITYASVLGGGYNRGENMLSGAIGANPGNINSWCERMASRNSGGRPWETRNYMSSLQRCMRRGNYEPPVNGQDPGASCPPTEPSASVQADRPCSVAPRASSTPQPRPASFTAPNQLNIGQ